MAHSGRAFNSMQTWPHRQLTLDMIDWIYLSDDDDMRKKEDRWIKEWRIWSSLREGWRLNYHPSHFFFTLHVAVEIGFVCLFGRGFSWDHRSLGSIARKPIRRHDIYWESRNTVYGNTFSYDSISLRQNTVHTLSGFIILILSLFIMSQGVLWGFQFVLTCCCE